MNLKFLIFADQLVKPIYILASLLPKRKILQEENHNFFILKFFGFGSITRVSHVIDNIGIPKNKITFITLYNNKALIDLLNLKAIYVYTNTPLALFVSLLKVISYVWKTKKYSLLDMERTSNLSGILRLILSFRKPCSSFYYGKNNKAKNGQYFVSLKNKSTLKAIAEMFHKQYNQAEKHFLKTNTNKIFININAGDYLPERKFPIDKYVSLIEELHSENPNWVFYLTGTNSERNYVTLFEKRLIEHKIPKEILFNIAGKYDLSQFITRLKEAKVLITNDSGPLHLAHFFNIKTVGIWGPTSSKLIGYQNSKQMLNLDLNIDCSPCFIHPKSKIAKQCNGKLTCFSLFIPKKMALEITKFVHNP
ncbi:glycosyltransferase family 9 protein [Tenacibaculum xiamenense]|uniref:glycosyltransferase family 9 protein n=1 Tax=Tenacibaculum xiamenense TaxID=1261553 RepID=UPI003895B704